MEIVSLVFGLVVLIVVKTVKMFGTSSTTLTDINKVIQTEIKKEMK